MEFKVDAGDAVLDEHLQSAKKNVRYTSKTIQNEIIQILGEHIQQEVLDMMAQNQPFSIIADEACDSSNKEQLPLVLRFVDRENKIREMFIGFYECEHGTTGQAIADLILEALTGLGVNMEYCRGQCYD